MPLLSICIPTYNRAECLALCLDRLLPQIEANPEAELVISNNASTDGTHTILARFEGAPRVRVYYNDVNIGLDENLIAVVERAQSDYVALMSDDDVPLDNYVATLLDRIQKYRPSVLYCNYYGFSKDWKTPTMAAYAENDIVFDRGDELIELTALGHFSALTMRRDLALAQIPVAREFGQKGFSRAYALYALGLGSALAAGGPAVLVGPFLFAARSLGTEEIDYDFITNVEIDYARHLNYWVERGLFDPQCRAQKLRQILYSLPQHILSKRLVRREGITTSQRNALRGIYGSKLYYWMVAEPLMGIPRFLLAPPYFSLRWLIRRMRTRKLRLLLPKSTSQAVV